MEKILRISEIIIDKEYYPRVEYNFGTVLSYAEALRNGAIFPPIKVALIKKKYYLIDGVHRIKMFQYEKKEHIKAEVVMNLSFKELYEEAVKANVNHGLAFTQADKDRIIIKMHELKFTPERINSILKVSLLRVKNITVGEMKIDLGYVPKGSSILVDGKNDEEKIEREEPKVLEFPKMEIPYSEDLNLKSPQNLFLKACQKN
jgi:hypothetical protein